MPPTHRKDTMTTTAPHQDEPIFNTVLAETNIPYQEIVSRPKWNQEEAEARLRAVKKAPKKQVAKKAAKPR